MVGWVGRRNKERGRQSGTGGRAKIGGSSLAPEMGAVHRLLVSGFFYTV
jgi:hypothetical protein